MPGVSLYRDRVSPRWCSFLSGATYASVVCVAVSSVCLSLLRARSSQLL